MDIVSDTTFSQCGRDFGQREIQLIQDTVKLFPRLSRFELNRTICEHLEWYTASGSNKADACSKLLDKLEAAGLIQLPPMRKKEKNRSKDLIEITPRTKQKPELICDFKTLGEVTIEIVKDSDTVNLWREYVDRYHYLGDTKPFGFYMRYFIKSRFGLLGCVLFSGAAKSIGVRDKWIGWTESQRLRNLSWVVNNSRFLLFPWVKVKNLASHILGSISRRITQDWHERWGYRPFLMETFIDGNYYSGTIYKAANWINLGVTTGEGLVRKGKSYKTAPKHIFVYPLTKKFRDTLCSEKLNGRIEI